MNRGIPLSILTYNIWGLKIGPFHIAPEINRRIGKMIHAIGELDSDFVALQEVWCDSIAEKFRSESGYPFTRYLPDRRGIKGRIGNGLMLLSKYPIVGHRRMTFTTHTRWYEYFANKGVQMFQVKTPAGKINIFNTHLGSGSAALDQHRRAQQVKELEKFIQQSGRRNPILLAGDLNFSPDSKEYPAFSQWMTAYFNNEPSDTFRRINPRKNGHTFFSERSFPAPKDACTIDERIDYIFSLTSKSNRSTLDIIGSRVVLNDPENPLSDHAGVMSTFMLTPNATMEEALDMALSHYDSDKDIKLAEYI